MVFLHKQKKIIITGKNSRFCNFLKYDLKNYNCIFTSKKEFNILNIKQIEKFVKKKK